MLLAVAALPACIGGEAVPLATAPTDPGSLERSFEESLASAGLEGTLHLIVGPNGGDTILRSFDVGAGRAIAPLTSEPVSDIAVCPDLAAVTGLDTGSGFGLSAVGLLDGEGKMRDIPGRGRPHGWRPSLSRECDLAYVQPGSAIHQVRVWSASGDLPDPLYRSDIGIDPKWGGERLYVLQPLENTLPWRSELVAVARDGSVEDRWEVGVASPTTLVVGKRYAVATAFLEGGLELIPLTDAGVGRAVPEYVAITFDPTGEQLLVREREGQRRLGVMSPDDGRVRILGGLSDGLSAWGGAWVPGDWSPLASTETE